MAVWRRGRSGMMIYLVLTIFLCRMVGSVKEIIVENPFYLRARVYDAHTANVQFEIGRDKNQRTCQMYKFTIRHNRDYPYAMPEQNLTFWRNSLELKHLAEGNYRICAVICSEYLKRSTHLSYEFVSKRNRSTPISACVNIHAYRSHFLVLTLYILVFIILAFSQIIFSLRRRKTRASIKTALIDVEHAIQKWRSSQTTTTTTSTDGPHSFTILQSLVGFPTVPVDQTILSLYHSVDEEHQSLHPINFHLGLPNEPSASEVP